ncbi:MAG: hypothetical protein P4L39_00860 [Humidesulfovibrio sp.]|nr:hypothetical protein [Humidesulfovibrio sp.]
MTIASVGNRYLGSALDYIDQNSSTDVLTTMLATSSSSSAGFTPVENTGTDSTDSSDSTSGTSISTAATLLSSLSTLQKQDTESFKEATSEIATSLHEAAADSTDTMEKYQLNSLAGQFSNASTTGSLASVTSSGTSSSLRGYGSSSASLASSYLSGNLSSSVFTEVNSIVQSKLNSVLATS